MKYVGTLIVLITTIFFNTWNVRASSVVSNEVANSASKTTTNDLAMRWKTIEKAGDITAISQWLADLEKLWPDHAEAYFTLLNTSVIERRIYSIYSDLDGFRHKAENRDSLIVCAKRLGELRASRIPDYKKIFPLFGNSSSVGALNKEEQKELQQRYQQDRRNRLILHIQEWLENLDRSVTEYFMQEAEVYLQAHLDDKMFIDEVVVLARLNSGERQQLEAARKSK